MGEVYLVQHPRLPRFDALKILPVQFTIDREYRERFNREADMVARLWHPHIVGVHDRGEDDGQLWITMDFVEGTDAAKLLPNMGAAACRPRMSCGSWRASRTRSTTRTSRSCCIAT